MEAALEMEFEEGLNLVTEPPYDGDDDLLAYLAHKIVVKGIQDVVLLHEWVTRDFHRQVLKGVRDHKVNRAGQTEPIWRPWTLPEIKLVIAQPECQSTIRELRAELQAQADEEAAEAQRGRARFAGLVKRARAEQAKSSLLMAEVLELRRVVRVLMDRVDRLSMVDTEYRPALPEEF